MTRSEYKGLGIVLVALICAAGIFTLIYIPEDRLSLGGIFVLILIGSIWRLYEGYRSTEHERGWQNRRGEWEDNKNQKEPKTSTANDLHPH